MTPYTPDELALLRACVEHPDEDTPRLALADLLDERPTVSVPCSRCKGKGAYSYDGAEFGYTVENCPDCGGTDERRGTGVVADTSARDRAELIRVQCELAVYECGSRPTLPEIPKPGAYRTASKFQFDDRYFDLQERERSLIAANAGRWRRGPACEECKGARVAPARWIAGMGGRAPEQCERCHGTGDGGGLMWRTSVPSHRAERTRVEYVRGMKRVHATSADLWERVHGNRHGEMDAVTWRPTAWLTAVVTHHPDVCEMWVDDREAAAGAGFSEGRFGWCTHSGLGTGFVLARVPDPLILLMRCELGETGLWRWSTSADAARVALARAVVRWAHAHLSSPNGVPA